MSSSKSSSNSSKTAHVMNLLRKNTSAPSHSPSVQAPAEDSQAVQSSQPVSPAPQPVPQPAPAAPIITALNADSEISMQIRDALTEELAQEAENAASVIPSDAEIIESQAATAPESPAPPQKKSVKAVVDTLSENPKNVRNSKEDSGFSHSDIADGEKPQSGSTAGKSSSGRPETDSTAENHSAVPEDLSSKSLPDSVVSPGEQEKVLADSAVPDNSSVKSEPAEEKQEIPSDSGAAVPAEPVLEPEASDRAEEDSHKPVLVNIMRQIVEDKAEKYMRIFGVCRCSQCRNDVIALALNNLPSKYAVMDSREITLKSDMYEIRYNCEIIAQLMRACKAVKENPRHNK